MNKESLIDFPTAFPVKALGKDVPELRQTVLDLVAEHAKFDPDADVKDQVSSNGNFRSITVTLQAENQEQLDTIYQSLHDHDLIMMVF
jgi:putative lipoic acid-binding regulatory protein